VPVALLVVPKPRRTGKLLSAEENLIPRIFISGMVIPNQAASAAQVIRLATTAIPSIVRCEETLAWHPGKSGDYDQRAPGDMNYALARVTAPGFLEMGGFSS
jgi:hypothetical protein